MVLGLKMARLQAQPFPLLMYSCVDGNVNSHGPDSSLSSATESFQVVFAYQCMKAVEFLSIYSRKRIASFLLLQQIGLACEITLSKSTDLFGVKFQWLSLQQQDPQLAFSSTCIFVKGEEFQVLKPRTCYPILRDIIHFPPQTVVPTMHNNFLFLSLLFN